MSEIISRISEPVRRKGAERYLQLSLLGFAASVTLTRFLLWITGYPQLGSGTLHIAHVLYGGILLYIACLLPLIYANRWAYTWSSILSGVGVGLFIDEVGKFITQNNDYFFPAAAPIIYAFFLTSVLIYNRIAKESAFDARTEFYAVLETLEEVLDHDMNPEEQKELRSRLDRIKNKAPNSDLGFLSEQILEFINSESIHITPEKSNFFDKAIDWINSFEEKWFNKRRFRLLVIMGVLLWGLAGGLRLVYYTAGGPAFLESLLRERVANLPVAPNVSMFWAGVQLAMEGLTGFILLISGVLLILGKERIGLGLGSIGLMLSLVGVNLIQFYIDQFSTIAKAVIQFLTLQLVYHYQRRFHI